MQNPYIPYPVELIKIVTEVDTKDIKTFRFAFVNKEDEEKYKYIPGQFGDNTDLYFRRGSRLPRKHDGCQRCQTALHSISPLWNG